MAIDVRVLMEWEERRKIEHFRIRYELNGEKYYCRVDGRDKRDAKKEALKAKGAKITSCKKLYPFSTEKNQHNIELVHMVCVNTISDIFDNHLGQPLSEEDWEEIRRLEALDDKAEKYRGLELPVAWLEWEQLEEVRELCFLAREHRANACIEAGKPELVKYC